MLIRLVLIVAALCLALAGCMQHAGHRKHKRVAQPAQHRLALPAPGKPLYLRGPMEQANWKAPAPLAPQPILDAPIVQAAATDAGAYRLDSGDRLRIVVFGQDNLSQTYGVDGGGFISMPLIGAVEARGATTFELADRIAAKLRVKYVKDPKVTVEIQAYRPFFILGEVKRPGQYPYVNDMTVQTAVAIAGGYTERARERKAKLTRRDHGRAVTMKVPPYFPIRPGDTIDVPERLF